MRHILIHLHPDFAEELESLLKKWNFAQDYLKFQGFRPAKEIESLLFSSGAIELKKTLEIAMKIREEAGFKGKDSLLIFTEKRIFTKGYYQLYFGGEGNVGTISLDFTRKLFSSSSKNEHYIFRAIIANILNAISQQDGLECHDQTKGCFLDFCNNMPDLIKGIEGGHKFCHSHVIEIESKSKNYLLALAKATANVSELADQDVEITRKVGAFDTPVEIGIVVALEEEFREVFTHIKHKAKPVFNANICQYYYVFEMGHGTNPYRCVITFIGGMGTDKAAIVGDRLMEQFKPHTIVNIGIAGSTDKDAFIGDIIIAEQSDKYLHAARAIADSDTASYKFQLSGDPYKTTPTFLSHARNLDFAYPEQTEQWRKVCSDKLVDLLGIEKCNELVSKRNLRKSPKILTGNIASESILGVSELFIKWLKDNRDRKYIAIEMESVGVLNAAYTRSTATLIIRGISDYADLRKKDFDQLNDGALRRYAMNNAILLLWLLMDLQLLEHKKQ